LTLFVSLYGGLVITLRLITPFLMKIILKMKEKLKNPNNNSGNRDLSLTFVQSMKRLNLFKMANQRAETDIEQQRLITRLYLTLLIGKFPSNEFKITAVLIFFVIYRFNYNFTFIQYTQERNSHSNSAISVISDL